MSTDDDHTDWRGIVTRGVESEELDYKAAQNWTSLNRHGKAKFARHCMALANTKGGYIVVGVGEDKAGKPSLFTGLTDAQTKSFDPTNIGNFINRFADPPIDFDIYRPTIDGKTYAIFLVRRFRELPHVCSHNCDNELSQGSFYIRTADASSRVAYRASEVHDIVQRALRNQREILGRMLRGILYEKGQKPEPMAESLFHEQLRHADSFFCRNAGKDFLKEPRFSFHCYPGEFYKAAFDLPDIRQAVEDSLIMFRHETLFALDNDEETYFTNVSLRSLSVARRFYFQAFRSGLCHYERVIAKEGNVNYADLLHHVIESVSFLGSYYSRMECDTDLMTLVVELHNVDGVMLKMKGRTPRGKQCVCRIPDIRLDMKRSGADLVSGVVEHSRRVFREICHRFNLPDGWHRNIENMVKEYVDRRI